MVGWNAPGEILRDSEIFERFMHVILGLYVWEWFMTLPFDWEYVSGKRKFKWAMIFYFVNRYSLLFALVGISITFTITSEINCQALYTFIQVVGNLAIGTASINLALRTIAIWSRKWYIVAPLTVVILGHWSLLLQAVQLKAVYSSELKQCVIVETNNGLMAAIFIYSMSFDFVILVLTAVKLFSGSGYSRFRGFIFNDGLIYFVIAFVANTIATTFTLMNLNPIMSIIANVPAATAATIVACRVVRRLSNFVSQTVEVFPSSRPTLDTPPALRQKIATKVTATQVVDGVHVQVETFENPDAGYGIQAAGNMKGDTYDPEAQHISDEFKRPY